MSANGKMNMKFLNTYLNALAIYFTFVPAAEYPRPLFYSVAVNKAVYHIYYIIIDISKYKGFVINVAHYDEINELYLASDAIITDYSSIFFDFANLHRPMFFYMYDYDDYKNNLRDFYISLDELPGPIAKTQDELEKNISNIDKMQDKYAKKYAKFNKKYNYLDDGNASERVLKVIFKEELK